MNKRVQEALLARFAELGDPTTTIILVTTSPRKPPSFDVESALTAKVVDLPPQKPTPVLSVVKRLRAQAREKRGKAQREQRAQWRREHNAGQSAHRHSGWFNKKSFHRAVGGA